MNTTELSSLTVPQLRQLAREASIPGRSRMRKAELIAALAEVAQAPGPRPHVEYGPLAPSPEQAARQNAAREAAQANADATPEAPEAPEVTDEPSAATRSGYHDCACAGCSDTQFGYPGEVCSLCEEAGCSDDGDQECYRGEG